jgi:CubicO group peptidase (beta-lactamase class C family)
MMREHIPGLSLAVVKDGKMAYARGFGARDLKAGLPATPDTLYGIGSITKSFTAMAIMQLQEAGKLNVDDPVSKHLPEFKLGKEGKPIAIRHLLSHSSGIPDLGAADVGLNRQLDGEEKWTPMTSYDDFVTFVNGAKDEVVADPGTRFFYLNEGYVLLGRVVEKASGMRYEDYVTQKILRPLKMKHSGFPMKDFEKDGDVATMYKVQKKDNTLVGTPFGPSSFISCFSSAYADGLLLSSVVELCNYLTACMNKGTFDGTRVLGESSMEEILKPRIDVGYPTIFGKMNYGYGWGVYEDFFGHKCIGHTGGLFVSGGDLRFVPDLNLGVAVAFNNSMSESAYLVASAVLLLFMGKDPMKLIPTFEMEKRLGQLTGEYRTYKGIEKVSVVRKGGILFLESKEKLYEQSLALIPESDKFETLNFYILTGGTRLPAEFVIDSSGKVDLFIERNRFRKVK